MWYARPIPASRAIVKRSGALGNVSVETGRSAPCGFRDERVRVFCFDQDWRLDAASQLELLELVHFPVTVQVHHPYAGDRVSAIIAERPERLANALIERVDDATCRGACERRVTIAASSAPVPQPSQPPWAPPLPRVGGGVAP